MGPWTCRSTRYCCLRDQIRRDDDISYLSKSQKNPIESTHFPHRYAIDWSYTYHLCIFMYHIFSMKSERMWGCHHYHLSMAFFWGRDTQVDDAGMNVSKYSTHSQDIFVLGRQLIQSSWMTSGCTTHMYRFRMYKF